MIAVAKEEVVKKVINHHENLGELGVIISTTEQEVRKKLEIKWKLRNGDDPDHSLGMEWVELKKKATQSNLKQTGGDSTYEKIQVLIIHNNEKLNETCSEIFWNIQPHMGSIHNIL